MENDAVSTWLEKQSERSGAYYDYLHSNECKKQNPDKTFEWGERLGALLENENTLPAGVLIAGPEGCGRHTIMTNILLSLDLYYPDKFYEEFITGWDLEDDTGSFRQAQEKLEALLEDYKEQNRDLCLVLDELEAYPFREALLHFLEKTVCAYRTEKECPKLLLILIQNEAYRVPAILKKMLYPCRVQYPDAEQRREFLLEALRKTKHDTSVESMAEETDGFSYADLWALVENIRVAAQADPNNIIQDKMKHLLREQQRPAAVADEKKRLYQKLEQTLDSLPELLAKLPQREVGISTQEAGTQGMATQAAKTEKVTPLNEKRYLAQEQERLDSFTGRDLMVDLLSEEFVENGIQ